MASITIKNVGRLVQRLNNIANLDLTERMTKATSSVHAQAKLLAPVSKGEFTGSSGQLAGSIHMEVKKRLNSVEGRVYTNLSYAPFVEFGTGIKGNGSYPHKVKGLNLSSYRNTPWVYTPDDGEHFFRTLGQVARPYMYPALKQNEKYIKQLFKDGVKIDLAKAIKGGK